MLGEGAEGREHPGSGGQRKARQGGRGSLLARPMPQKFSPLHRRFSSLWKGPGEKRAALLTSKRCKTHLINLHTLPGGETPVILPLRSAGAELLPRGDCSVPGRLSSRGDPSRRQPPGPGNSQQARRSEARSGPCPGGQRGPVGSRHPTHAFLTWCQEHSRPPGPLHHMSRKQDHSGSSPPPPPTPICPALYFC